MNFVQNYAAKESMEAAGLDEYEFIAVLDHRTTPRCQALDGTLHLLKEYSPGTNAPPAKATKEHALRCKPRKERLLTRVAGQQYQR